MILIVCFYLFRGYRRYWSFITCTESWSTQSIVGRLYGRFND